MEVSCTQENLNRALSIVSRAANPRNNHPYVIMEADEGMLHLRAGDYELALDTSIPCLANQTGKAALPANLLSQVTKCLDHTRVDIVQEQDDESKTTRISAGRNVSNFVNNVEQIRHEPHPELAGTVMLSIDPKELQRGLRHTSFAVSKGMERPILNAVNFKTEGKKLALAAADGFRLSVQEIEMEEAAGEDLELNVPYQAASEIMRLLPGSEGPVSLSFGHYASAATGSRFTRGLFRSESPEGAVEMRFSLLDGNFPNYTQLIPESPHTVIKINRQILNESVGRAGLFAKESSNIVKLLLTPGDPEQGQTEGAHYLSVIAESPEIGDIKEPLEVVDLAQEPVDDPTDRIAFNYQFLSDVLKAVCLGDDSARDLSIELKGKQSPGVVRVPEDPAFVHVLMPMFVQW